MFLWHVEERRDRRGYTLGEMEAKRSPSHSACQSLGYRFLKDIQPPPSPNTQLTLEQATTSIDGPMMPSDPSLDNSNLCELMLSTVYFRYSNNKKPNIDWYSRHLTLTRMEQTLTSCRNILSRTSTATCGATTNGITLNEYQQPCVA
jgi:hypothetical protein